MAIFVNFAAFQLGWFSAVIGAAKGMPWVGPLVIAVALLLHLRRAERPVEELGLALAAAVLGTWFDSALVAMGWVGYSSGQLHAMIAPYWIVAMWVLFATTLNLSLRWLRGRAWLAAIVGAISGPLTYVAGSRLGAMEFLNAEAALIALAIGWAVMLPALVALGTRLDGFSERPVEVALR
ncbi:MAG: DUF2878 domain-containing protein [Pseudomonadota bacterium]